MIRVQLHQRLRIIEVLAHDFARRLWIARADGLDDGVMLRGRVGEDRALHRQGEDAAVVEQALADKIHQELIAAALRHGEVEPLVRPQPLVVALFALAEVRVVGVVLHLLNRLV